MSISQFPSIQPDIEGALYNKFASAHTRGALLEQIDAICSIAKLRLQSGDLYTSAHLVAAGAHLAEKSSAPKEISRLEQMAVEIEDQAVKRKRSNRCSSRLKYQKSLEQIRNRASTRLGKGSSAIAICRSLSEEFAALLLNLTVDSFADLGQAKPSSFAIAVTGSMARKEMAPYSDLEFFFLVGKEVKERGKKNLRRVAELLTIKTILIGESDYPILRSKQGGKSIARRGFSIDTAGLNPIGKKGIYSLIDTPKNIAKLQKEKWFKNHSSEIALLHSLLDARYVIGDPNLVKEYQKRIGAIWSAKEKLSREPLRKRRAMSMLRAILAEFEVRLGEEKIALRAFDAKREALRPIQMCISALSAYFKIDRIETAERISLLHKRGVLSKGGAKQLNKALETALHLRLSAQLHYKTERDILYFPRSTFDASDQGLFIIKGAIQQKLSDLYRVIRPLFKCAKAFAGGKINAFASAPLWDRDMGDETQPYRHLSNASYIKAEESAQALVALNPNSLNARMQLHWAGGFRKKGRLENLYEALSLAQKQEQRTQILFSIATEYRGAGGSRESAYYQLCAMEQKKGYDWSDLLLLAMDFKLAGNRRRAVHYYELALEGCEKQKEKSAFAETRVHIYRELHQLHRALGNQDAARACQEMLKRIGSFQAKPGDELCIAPKAEIYKELESTLSTLKNVDSNAKRLHQVIGTSYCTAAARFSVIGDWPAALRSYTEASQNYKRVWKDCNNFLTQQVINGLTLAASHLGKGKEAIAFGRQALKSAREFTSDPIQEIVSLLALAKGHEASGELQLSLQKAKQAERASSSQAIGRFWGKYSSLSLARSYRLLEEYKQSIAWIHRVLNPPHSFPNYGLELQCFAIAETELGALWTKRGKPKRAIAPLRRALDRLDTLYEEIPNLLSGEVNSILADAYLSLGDLNAATGHMHRATTLYNELLGGADSFLKVALLRTESKLFLRLGSQRDAEKSAKLSLEMCDRLTTFASHHERLASLALIQHNLNACSLSQFALLSDL